MVVSPSLPAWADDNAPTAQPRQTVFGERPVSNQPVEPRPAPESNQVPGMQLARTDEQPSALSSTSSGVVMKVGSRTYKNLAEATGEPVTEELLNEIKRSLKALSPEQGEMDAACTQNRGGKTTREPNCFPGLVSFQAGGSQWKALLKFITVSMENDPKDGKWYALGIVVSISKNGNEIRPPVPPTTAPPEPGPQPGPPPIDWPSQDQDLGGGTGPYYAYMAKVVKNRLVLDFGVGINLIPDGERIYWRIIRADGGPVQQGIFDNIKILAGHFHAESGTLPPGDYVLEVGRRPRNGEYHPDSRKNFTIYARGQRQPPGRDGGPQPSPAPAAPPAPAPAPQPNPNPSPGSAPSPEPSAKNTKSFTGEDKDGKYTLVVNNDKKTAVKTYNDGPKKGQSSKYKNLEFHGDAWARPRPGQVVVYEHWNPGIQILGEMDNSSEPQPTPAPQPVINRTVSSNSDEISGERIVKLNSSYTLQELGGILAGLDLGLSQDGARFLRGSGVTIQGLGFDRELRTNVILVSAADPAKMSAVINALDVKYDEANQRIHLTNVSGSTQAPQNPPSQAPVRLDVLANRAPQGRANQTTVSVSAASQKDPDIPDVPTAELPAVLPVGNGYQVSVPGLTGPLGGVAIRIEPGANGQPIVTIRDVNGRPVPIDQVRLGGLPLGPGALSVVDTPDGLYLSIPAPCLGGTNTCGQRVILIPLPSDAARVLRFERTGSTSSMATPNSSVNLPQATALVQNPTSSTPAVGQPLIATAAASKPENPAVQAPIVSAAGAAKTSQRKRIAMLRLRRDRRIRGVA